MKPIVISFYTVDTPYEKEVKRLVESCLRFDIEADIVGIASEGSWERNCARKPFFILDALKKWNRPVLWVDADAVFLQSPDFTEFDSCDFSVRLNEFLPKKSESRIVSNIIFVRNNFKAIAVLERWCQVTESELNCKERVFEFWDQIALRDVLDEESDLRFLPMPLKFAKIFDFDDLFISESEVVIEHYQASRRLKHTLCNNQCCH